MSKLLLPKLGLFIKNDFLPADLAAEIVSEMSVSQSKAAAVSRAAANRIDEEVRQTKVVKVSKSTHSLVKERLQATRPELESHFNVSLRGHEDPQFLHYGKGDFFLAHPDKDDNPDSDAYVRERQISAVMFLNSQEEEVKSDCYGGGSLVFYGLIKDNPVWEEYGFPVAGKSGMLVAFRSEIIHEVKPVTYGDRYTIVTWFV